jgi:hypothetical protein
MAFAPLARRASPWGAAALWHVLPPACLTSSPESPKRWTGEPWITSQSISQHASVQSLQSESCGPWKVQRPTAFEPRGSAPAGIPQTQTNRPQFGGMCEDEFARHPERAGQFTDGHERIDFGIDHSLQPRHALGV